MSDWRDSFEVVDGSDKARKKCSLCGVVLDVRAGRAGKHLASVHGFVNGPVPVNKKVLAVADAFSPPSAAGNPFPRGSREWGIEYLRSLIDHPAISPEARLKALGELREWESFEGTAAFDDEIEVEKHMEQWDRVVKRAKELRELSKKILRDATTRADLLRQITEVGG